MNLRNHPLIGPISPLVRDCLLFLQVHSHASAAGSGSRPEREHQCQKTDFFLNTTSVRGRQSPIAEGCEAVTRSEGPIGAGECNYSRQRHKLRKAMEELRGCALSREEDIKRMKEEYRSLLDTKVALAQRLAVRGCRSTWPLVPKSRLGVLPSFPSRYCSTSGFIAGRTQ